VRRLQIIGVSAVAALYSFMVLDHVEAGDPLTPTVLLLDLLEAALLGLAVLLVALFCVEARERARLRSVLMYVPPTTSLQISIASSGRGI